MMAHCLEGKTPLSANDLSPKEATQMSRDIKYIPQPTTTPDFHYFKKLLKWV